MTKWLVTIMISFAVGAPLDYVSERGRNASQVKPLIPAEGPAPAYGEIASQAKPLMLQAEVGLEGYTLGLANTNHCPEGTAPYTSKEACESAFQVIKKNYPSARFWSGSYSSSPKGCYTVEGYGHTCWNTHATGGTRDIFQPVCKTAEAFTCGEPPVGKIFKGLITADHVCGFEFSCEDHECFLDICGEPPMGKMLQEGRSADDVCHQPCADECFIDGHWSHKYLSEYIQYHDGHCATGLIYGSHAHTATIALCDDHCKATTHCGFFSYAVGLPSTAKMNCALYTLEGGCDDDDNYPEFNSYRMTPEYWTPNHGREPSKILLYTGTEHGCKSMHGQCYWMTLADAKKGCHDWRECGAFFETDVHSPAIHGNPVYWARQHGELIDEIGATAWIHEDPCNERSSDKCSDCDSEECCENHFVTEGGFSFNCDWDQFECSTGSDSCLEPKNPWETPPAETPTKGSDPTFDEHDTVDPKQMTILVMQLNFKDYSAGHGSDKDVENVIWGELGFYESEGSFAHMIDKASYGRLTAPRTAGAVVSLDMGEDWGNAVNCPVDLVATKAHEKLVEQHPDIEMNDYDFHAFMLPKDWKAGCPWTGLGRLGCGHPSILPLADGVFCPSWYFEASRSIFPHELGHNLGLSHSQAPQHFNKLNGDYTMDGWDPEEPMSNAGVMVDYNAAHRYHLDVLREADGEILTWANDGEWVSESIARRRGDDDSVEHRVVALQSISSPLDSSGDYAAIRIPCADCVPETPGKEKNVGGDLFVQFRGNDGYSNDFDENGHRMLIDGLENSVYVHLRIQPSRWNNEYGAPNGKGTELWAMLSAYESWSDEDLKLAVYVCKILPGELAEVSIAHDVATARQKCPFFGHPTPSPTGVPERCIWTPMPKYIIAGPVFNRHGNSMAYDSFEEAKLQCRAYYKSSTNQCTGIYQRKPGDKFEIRTNHWFNSGGSQAMSWSCGGFSDYPNPYLTDAKGDKILQHSRAD